jgi:hypothetical protein
MSKVNNDDPDDDLIYQGDKLTIRAMRTRNGRTPAKEWFLGLDKRGLGQVTAAARVLENTILRGRPPSGRAEKITTSTEGLWELRVTKAGGTPPHLRLTYNREGNTLWAATGFAKTRNKLDRHDIRAADRVAREWREGRENPA